MNRRRIRPLEHYEELAAYRKQQPEPVQGPLEVVIGGKKNSWLAKGLVAGEGSPMRQKADRIVRDALLAELRKRQLYIPAHAPRKPVATMCNVPLYEEDLQNAEETNLIDILVEKLLLLGELNRIIEERSTTAGHPIRVLPPLMPSPVVNYAKPDAETAG